MAANVGRQRARGNCAVSCQRAIPAAPRAEDRDVVSLPGDPLHARTVLDAMRAAS